MKNEVGDNLKLALGMITKDLLTEEPLDQFLENSEKFGHHVDSVVIGYSDKIDESIVEALRQKVKVHLVKIKQSGLLHHKLLDLGLSKDEIIPLIGDITEACDGRSAYGISRNHVIIEAILQDIDILCFIDTDVYPEVVIKKKDLQDTGVYKTRETTIEDVYIQEVDFLGEHLKYLEDEKVKVTTSDYTGYYIIPPMQFPGMQDLFYGLKKETAYNYIMDSFHHHCLSTDHGIRRNGFRTEKVLGGNVAIKLDLFKTMVPFFSTIYEVEGGKYLTRGEDTVLAIQLKTQQDHIFYDIDMKIFHNTYSHFPTVPDILRDQHIKDRFFYACMGWIGRNPFLNDIRGLNPKSCYELEHHYLLEGAKAISQHLDDDRFNLLPKAHEIAYRQLDDMKAEFERFKTSWFEFIRRIG